VSNRLESFSGTTSFFAENKATISARNVQSPITRDAELKHATDWLATLNLSTQPYKQHQENRYDGDANRAVG
jgi:hypothetical protein